MDPEGALHHRRRVPRQEVSWKGTCHFGDATSLTDCEVVDISVVGVGLEILGGPGVALEGKTITVEIETAAAVSLRLVGEVRYAMAVAGDRIRIGIQFVGLSDTERSILDTFERMQLAW